MTNKTEIEQNLKNPESNKLKLNPKIDNFAMEDNKKFGIVLHWILENKQTMINDIISNEYKPL